MHLLGNYMYLYTLECRPLKDGTPQLSLRKIATTVLAFFFLIRNLYSRQPIHTRLWYRTHLVLPHGVEDNRLVCPRTEELEPVVVPGEAHSGDGSGVVGDGLDGMVVCLDVGENVDHPIPAGSGQVLHP